MTTLLSLHKEWSKKRRISASGLCHALHRKLPIEYAAKFQEYFKPNNKEMRELVKNGESQTFWGSGLKYNDERRLFTYTERRQNLLLLLAAIMDEL